jgi:hypothetical protein
MSKIYGILVLFACTALAQDSGQKTNSFFDDSEAKTFAAKSILIEGEVENPGPVDLTSLPIRNCVVKEVVLENGKPEFKGAFYYIGHSLFDILNSKKVKKVAENAFSPSVDLYAIVENGKGEKAVFSWGEIFFSRDNFKILLSSSVQAINPSKLTSVRWQLPDEPRVICGNDLLNVRFLSNPTKITVVSYRGTFATEKPQNIYSPGFKIVSETKSVVVRDLGSSMEKRKYSNVGYGHGMGFKGIEELDGVMLKDVVQANVKVVPEDLRQGITVISAKDGYRSVFSMSEIANRSDNLDFLLIDKKGSQEEGRYTMFAAADFFVDRNVKAIEKMQIVKLR